MIIIFLIKKTISFIEVVFLMLVLKIYEKYKLGDMTKEECKKLFEIISTIKSGGYRIEDILNKYEEQEFYPIGEIEKVKVKFKGQEIEASKGTLANPKGEKRTILFYRGYEIKPDEE